VPDRTGVENEGGTRPYLFEHCDGKGGDGRFVWQPGAEKHDISALDIWHQLHSGNRINSAGRRFRNSEHQRFRDCYSERGGVARAGGDLKPSGAGTQRTDAGKQSAAGHFGAARNDQNIPPCFLVALSRMRQLHLTQKIRGDPRQ
jgi:hypothetical protein